MGDPNWLVDHRAGQRRVTAANPPFHGPLGNLELAYEC